MKSYAIYHELYGNEHPDTANALRDLGVLYRDMGDFEKAKECLYPACKILQRLYGDEHPNVVFSMKNLGILYRDAGDFKLAKKYFKQT